MSKWANVAQAAQWLDAGKIVHGRRRDGPSDWFYAEPDKICLSPDYEYRLAPRTIDIGGVKVNAPILERPKDAEQLVWFGTHSSVMVFANSAVSFSDESYANGCIWATEAEANAARDAIVRLLTGVE